MWSPLKTTLGRSSWLVLLVCLVLAGCPGPTPPPGPPAPPPATPVMHQLQVSEHTSLNLTDAGTDTILTDATTVAQTTDGPGDVACVVGVSRNGGLTTFPAPSIINSSAELNDVLALPGNVKVVNQINWCGGFAPNIIGCAPIPGTSLAVVRFTANQEGILWLHEFGHNKGLNHRNDPNAVMNPVIAPTRRFVDTTECNAYRAP